MELYIGGYAQGKLHYVKSQHPQEDFFLLDGSGAEAVLCGTENGKRVIFNHFHEWIKGMVCRGEDAEAQAAHFVAEHPDCIVISDEVGNGIVPVNPVEREYRERLGRILTSLAKEAERVDRILCGLGQRLK